MPKFLSAAVLIAATSLALGGCASALALANATEDRPVVVATFSVLADIVQTVAGDAIEVQSLTKFGAEIHGYEPTPGDVRQLVRADLIVENGWGLEAWFEQFTRAVDAPVLTLTDGLTPLPIAGSDHPNPHAWMSPTNVEHFVTVLTPALVALAPDRRAQIEANAAAYLDELRIISRDLRTAIATLPPAQHTLVTCEGAFSYLARDAGLDEAFLWPVNAEQQVTPQRVAAVIEIVAERDLAAVFCESTVSDRAMRQVAEATGAALGPTLYVDSLSLPEGVVPTYLDLIRHDVTAITNALRGEA